VLRVTPVESKKDVLKGDEFKLGIEALGQATRHGLCAAQEERTTASVHVGREGVRNPVQKKHTLQERSERKRCAKTGGKHQV